MKGLGFYWCSSKRKENISKHSIMFIIGKRSIMIITSALALAAFKIAQPYLQKAGEGAAGEAGKEAFKKVKELLGRNKEGEAALTQYELTPNEKTQKALIEHLTNALDNAPYEAKRLQTIVTNFNTQVNDHSNTTGARTEGDGNTIITHVGVPVQEYKNVVIELGRTEEKLEAISIQFEGIKNDVAKKDNDYTKTLQLSNEEINRLKNELEEERSKGDFDKQLNEKLSALDAQGAYEDADKLLEELDKKQNRENAKTKFHRAVYARLQLNYKAALAYYEQAILLDPENALYLNEVGLLLNDLGLPKRAIEFYEKSLVLFIESGEEYNESIAIVYNNLGTSFRALGDYQNAIKHLNKSLAIDIGIFGDKHSHVSTRYNNLGYVWKESGQYEKALDFLNKSLEMDIEEYGDMHPRIATKYSNIGSVFRVLGRHQEAIELYNKALDIQKDAKVGNSPVIAVLYNNLGSAWKGLGDYPKAIEFLNKTLEILKILYGEIHPNIAVSYNNLGEAYRKMGYHEKAIELYNKALHMDIALFGEYHYTVATRYNNLGLAWYHSNNNAKAIYYSEKGLQILETLYPDGLHENIKQCRENLAQLRNL